MVSLRPCVPNSGQRSKIRADTQGPRAHSVGGEVDAGLRIREVLGRYCPKVSVTN